MGNFVAQTSLSPPPQPYNGPRGPFAPVPANQGLLQPLIPTQTGFSGFIPAKPATNPSPFQNNLAPPSFLQSQPTGFNPQPLMSQPTGVFSNFSSVPSFQGANGAFGSIQSRFNPPMIQSPFGNGHPVASPPPLPSNHVNNTSPANVFAQMKSGTFASEPQNPPPGSNGAKRRVGDSRIRATLDIKQVPI
ncbi:hypothetical protein NLJ89_g5874 [Agrocybe chaxingu]|uniref:Uncharacterized protein n=1 Tax=Agrocybe chaxingu TaxID=84603 RepID=A0A9W8MWZ0_9AGAR|nr:hypothetical protein NLJ89_g5874 [Agrocybe chaxingu]